MSRLFRRSLVFSTTMALSGIVAFAASTSTSSMAPVNYGTFEPPAKGGTYEDPAFGTTVKRLSDAMNMTDNAGSGSLLSIGTEYSTASPFNSDNSRLILQHNSYFGLYDGNGNYLSDLPFAVNVSTEPRWARNDPNSLFYVKGNSLMKLNVGSGSSSVVKTFGEYGSINGMGESDISRDGDHFVFAGDNRHVFVYEISSGTKGQTLDTAGKAFNQLYIASNNSVAVGWIANGSGRYQGVELYDRNMNFQRQLTHAIGHMDLTVDNGQDVLIWNNSNDSQPIACQNGIVKVRLSDAQQTCLLELSWSLAVHITAPDGNGWAFVETYDPKDPFPQSSAWAPYTNEILQVKLDGSETRRLVHHRSRPSGDRYVYQPKVTSSRDGSKLAFTSNQSLQSIYGYPGDYSDGYMIQVSGSSTTPSTDPAGTPLPTPPPTSPNTPPTSPTTPTPAPTPIPPPPAGGGSLVEQNSSSVSYVGSWAPNGQATNSGGSAVLSMDQGSTATFVFSGKGASWIGYRDEWSGIATIKVDGVVKGTVDTYAPSDVSQATLYTISGLSNGTHSLTIEVTGTRRPGAAGSWIWVDAFAVSR